MKLTVSMANIVKSSQIMGKDQYPRSHLSESKQWNENVEKFYEKNPYRRRKN